MAIQGVTFLTWEANGETIVTEVHVMPSWEDTREAVFTEEPVERGTPITDHRAGLPPRLSVTVQVSQTPLFGGTTRPVTKKPRDSLFKPFGLFAITQGAKAAVGAAVGAIGGALGLGGGDNPGLATMQFDADDSEDIANELHTKLLDAFDNAYPVKLSLGTRPYDEYYIERLVKRCSEESEIMTFEVGLFRPKFVTTETALIAAPTVLPALPNLMGGKASGSRAATVTEDPDEAGGSLDSSLLNTLTGG